MEDALRQLSPQERADLQLIETLRHDPDTGLVRRDRHLARMARSAAALGLRFDRDRAVAALAVALASAAGPTPLRVRLTMDAGGEDPGRFAVTSAPLGPPPNLWRFGLADERLAADDPWLRHKTTRRTLYDRTRAALPPGVDEVLFLNTDGALCEGTITNLFVQRADRLLTPPLAAGLLPGILREALIDAGQAEEADLTPADLDGAEAVFFGNSLRGLIPAEPVA